MTPQDAQGLLNYPDNCSVQIKDVGNNCFRVNVFERCTDPTILIPHIKMRQSAYVKLTDDGYVDCTLHNK